MERFFSQLFLFFPSKVLDLHFFFLDHDHVGIAPSDDHGHAARIRVCRASSGRLCADPLRWTTGHCLLSPPSGAQAEPGAD